MGSRATAYGLAAFVFALDQLTKYLMLGPLDLRNVGMIDLLPIFRLTYTENHGISLGLLTASSDAARWLLVAFTTLIAAGVAVWIWREKSGGDRLALALVLGGALGNIADRSRHGYVVDFADLYFTGWPEALCWSYSEGSCRPFLIFNVGDAAISIGVAILLLRAFLLRNERPMENIEHA